ncbi:MAG TPA: STAS domain-containing protein [Spirochaetota bacterium]|nr:STAS domain-containing protein [Spirochaetota bacterium]HOL55926.1 STAS domain-containing protein [Spirochaetota bacterium]HPP03232.1 STAS domain-containing protein [Spirochaetota bacterium]
MREIKLKDNLSLIIEKEEEKFLVIALKGQINSQNSYSFQNEILNILKDTPFIIFDCKELNYITSSGIGAFLFIRNKLRNNNGNVFLINPQPKILSILGSMGVVNMIEEYNKILKIIESSNSFQQKNT